MLLEQQASKLALCMIFAPLSNNMFCHWNQSLVWTLVLCLWLHGMCTSPFATTCKLFAVQITASKVSTTLSLDLFFMCALANERLQFVAKQIKKAVDAELNACQNPAMDLSNPCHDRDRFQWHQHPTTHDCLVGCCLLGSRLVQRCILDKLFRSQVFSGRTKRHRSESGKLRSFNGKQRQWQN